MLPPVVDLEHWQRHRDDVVLADVRWYLDGRSGRAAHEAGHLPGAVFVDLDEVLSAAPSPREGRHPLPDPEAFAEGLGRLGLGEDVPVLAYDDVGGLVAARLVWMLRVTGQPAALLDGGLAAWHGPLERGPVVRPAVVRTPRPWPADRLAGPDDATDPRAVLLDVRDPERYRGEVEPVDPRPGHVPGARNVPARGGLDERGRLLPPERLRERFTAAGVGPDDDVVVSCGSGVNACHGLLALEVAGLGPGRLWPGSWSQWSADPARPAATGDEP